MTYWAYIDESEPALSSGKAAYVVAATIIAEADRSSVRQQITDWKPPHLRKVHWYEEPVARRTKLAAEIANYEALHQVVVRYFGAVESHERRRRLCLKLLLRELDAAGVTQLVVEARENTQNVREQRWVNDLRASKYLSRGLRIDHVPGPAEPLLWIPDVVAGAVGDQLKGNAQHVLALQAVLTVLTFTDA